MVAEKFKYKQFIAKSDLDIHRKKNKLVKKFSKIALILKKEMM